MGNYFITQDGCFHAISDDELYHHGVKGMKWGHRKAQPTSSGTGRRSGGKTSKGSDQESPEDIAAKRKARAKKALKIGAAVAATALAAYGAYKISKVVKERNTQKGREAVEKLARRELAAQKATFDNYLKGNTQVKSHVERGKYYTSTYTNDGLGNWSFKQSRNNRKETPEELKEAIREASKTLVKTSKRGRR